MNLNTIEILNTSKLEKFNYKAMKIEPLTSRLSNRIPKQLCHDNGAGLCMPE